MAAVTIAVYVAADAVDLYLLYGLVILGAALRFGLGAAVWSSLVMSAHVPGGGAAWAARSTQAPHSRCCRFGSATSSASASSPGSSAASSSAARRRTLGSRLRLVGGGAPASSDAGARAAQPARPGLRGLARARGHAARPSRSGAAPVLGGATIVFTIDDASIALVPAAAAGPDGELVEAWRARRGSAVRCAWVKG